MDYSEGFYITLAGLVIGFLGLTVRSCLRSKCDTVDMCCFKIHRTVTLEEPEINYEEYQKADKETNENSI